MARQRIEFSADVDAQIAALAARGGTAESISKALTAAGVKGASRSTIGRRLADVRGPVGAPRVKASGFAAGLAEAGGAPVDPPDPPESGGDLPPTAEEVAGADPATLASLLERARRAGAVAARDGNLAGIGAMGRLELQIQVEMRKAAPPERDDPNDAPDMVALGKQVADRLHKMVDLVVGE